MLEQWVWLKHVCTVGREKSSMHSLLEPVLLAWVDANKPSKDTENFWDKCVLR